MLARLQLRGVLLAFIPQAGDLLLPIQAVVVEVHLRIQGDQVPLAGDHQRVDLHQTRVQLGVGLVHALQEGHRRADLRTLQAQPEGDLAGVERLQADGRVDGDLDDLLRRLGGHLLDIHAALGGGHDGDPAGGAIEQEAQVELAGDVTALFDVDPLDLLARGPRLMGDQIHPEHLIGGRFDLAVGLDHLHAAALTAAAGVDLGLDHPHRPAQLLSGHRRLAGRERDLAPGYGYAELGEEPFGLIFMDIHSFSILMYPPKRKEETPVPGILCAGFLLSRAIRSVPTAAADRAA